MPHWLIKSAIHRAISWLPGSQFWNGLLQKHVTRSTAVTPSAFEEKLTQCARFYAGLQRERPGLPRLRVLELGTGWIPTVPVGLFLCGADELWTIDIDPLLNAERIATMAELYASYHSQGKLRQFLPAYVEERMPLVESLSRHPAGAPPEELLKALGIRVIVGDAQHLPLAAGSVDYIFSNGVLEYIPLPVLRNILEECRRVAAPGAVMGHRLNLIDQFSYFDKSITPYNFLRYTAAQWRWRNSPLIWQNRLRISDYRELFRAAGFEITREESESGDPAQLSLSELAPEFARYRTEDLLVLHSWITARLACPAHD